MYRVTRLEVRIDYNVGAMTLIAICLPKISFKYTLIVRWLFSSPACMFVLWRCWAGHEQDNPKPCFHLRSISRHSISIIQLISHWDYCPRPTIAQTIFPYGGYEWCKREENKKNINWRMQSWFAVHILIESHALHVWCCGRADFTRATQWIQYYYFSSLVLRSIQ